MRIPVLVLAGLLLGSAPASANYVCVGLDGLPPLDRVGLPWYSEGTLRWEPLGGGPYVEYSPDCDGIVKTDV